MRLSDYIESDLVLVGLDAGDTESAIRALAEHAASGIGTVDPGRAAQALLAREATHTTAMGEGVAIPHTTLEGLDRTRLLLATAPGGVAFGTQDGSPTRVFFTLLSPPGSESEHIRLLARICRLVRHPGFVDDLVSAESVDRVVAVVAGVDAQHV